MALHLDLQPMNGTDHITQEPNKGSTGPFLRKVSLDRISESTWNPHLRILDEHFSTYFRKFKNSQLRKNFPEDSITSQSIHATTLTRDRTSSQARQGARVGQTGILNWEPGSLVEVKDLNANNKTSWERDRYKTFNNACIKLTAF